MNRQNQTRIFYVIVVVVIFLFSACGNGNDVKSPYKEKEKFSSVKISDIPQEKLGTNFKLKKVKEIVLDSSAGIIGQIAVLKLKGDKILVSDPINSRQCYLFREDGTLLKKIGRLGEGPGEYFYVFAACFSGDRIFFVESRKVNIYSSDGDFIKGLPKPFSGICNAAYEGPNGSFYAVTTNRYNKKRSTIYQMDKDGNLLKTFSDLDDVPKVFDTFHPQTGLLTDSVSNKIFQYFNFINRLSVFDLKGNQVETITLDSPFYTAPDFSESKVKGHKAEKEYRASFTQIIDMFAYTGGYIIYYSNWKTVKKTQEIMEFRDLDFKRTGYKVLEQEGAFLAMHDDHLVFVRYTEDDTKLVFMSIAPSN